MGILFKKILRDIRYQKGRSFSIIIIIALAMGLYSGILLAYYNAEDSFTQAENNVLQHSARFVSAAPFNASDLSMNQFSGIKAWDTRLALLSSIYINGDKNDAFTAPLYGLPLNNQPNVDKLQILEGRYIRADHEVIMEKEFFDKNNFKLGQNITLVYQGKEVQLTVVGSVFSSEFIYNVNPKTGLPDLSKLAPVWGSLNYFQQLSGINGVNELVVRFTETIHTSETLVHSHADTILKYLHKDVNPTFAVVEHAKEPDTKMKKGDLGALDQFARVFGGVVLMIALFAIYDNISKMIAGQRNYIGTMRALGGSKRKVAWHYTWLAMLLSSVGVALGILIGALVNYGMVVEYTDIIGVPFPKLKLYPGPIMEALLIHLGLAFVISLSTSARAAGIKPREALSSSYITQVFRSKPWIERFLGSIGKLEPTTAIPIRNIFRNKRKTTLTILTFAMSIVLMLTAMSFIDSFNSAIDETYTQRQKYDLEVYLAQPMQSSQAMAAIDSVSHISKAEPFVNQLITLDVQGKDETKTTSVYGFEQNSTLRSFDIIDGDSSNAVISSLLATALNVKVGDSVDIVNSSVKISGIAKEVILEDVFMKMSVAQGLFNLHNNVTGLIIKVEDGANINTVKDDISKVLPVAVSISSQDVKSSIQYFIQGLFAMIGVMVLIGFLIVALFSFNTIVLEIISRENEFVNLLSLGSKNRKILKIILLQSLVVSIGGAAISIPLSYLVAGQAMDAMMEGLMSINAVIGLQAFIISIGSAFVASFTGIIAAYRHVKNIDMVNAMRSRVSN